MGSAHIWPSILRWLQAHPNLVFTTADVKQQAKGLPPNASIPTALAKIGRDHPGCLVRVDHRHWQWVPKLGAVQVTKSLTKAQVHMLFETVRGLKDGRTLLECEDGSLWVASRVNTK